MARKRGNGEGSITKRRDGRYMSRYTVHTTKGPKRRTVYGRTRKEAADKLAKALSDRVGGIVVDDENMTVGEYLDVWLKSSVRGSVRQSTYDRDASLVNNHLCPALGRIRLKKLSASHVQGFYRDRLRPWSEPLYGPQDARHLAQGAVPGSGVAHDTAQRHRSGQTPQTRT